MRASVGQSFCARARLAERKPVTSANGLRSFGRHPPPGFALPGYWFDRARQLEREHGGTAYQRLDELQFLCVGDLVDAKHHIPQPRQRRTGFWSD
jgi:hypothetical protein